jgi:hypothetical protein
MGIDDVEGCLMLTDELKLTMFDGLVERCDDLESAYDGQLKLIAEMSKAIHQALEAIYAAQKSLWLFSDLDRYQNEDRKKPKLPCRKTTC